MSKDKDVMLNEDIRANEIRCVGDDGTQYGIITRKEALAKADELGLDLVLMQRHQFVKL